jgi:methylmalonyl-CoA mutase C-terminal domain/subunit
MILYVIDVKKTTLKTGAHINISEKLIKQMKLENIGDIRVVVGGVIPKDDIPKLKALGVDGVFPNGTSFNDIIDGLKALV